MTNREKIVAELSELPTGEFYGAFADNRLCVAMDGAMCEDCMELFGPCPCTVSDGVPCRITTAAWLEMPCRHERMMPESSGESGGDAP